MTSPRHVVVNGKFLTAETTGVHRVAAELIRHSHALLQEDAEGQNLVPWGAGRFTSVWAAVDRRVAPEKEMTAALAQLRDGEARALLEPARQAGDLGRIITVYRRFPWSAAALEALAETGEQELRRGHAGLALRCFHATSMPE